MLPQFSTGRVDLWESEGTLRRDCTTIVVVRAVEAHKTGIGYTCADSATADLIRRKLAEIVRG